jgi:hypothetical protein
VIDHLLLANDDTAYLPADAIAQVLHEPPL